MSGRSKPPSVHCGIQLSAVPGRDPGIPSALFGLHPQGFTVPSIPADTLNELHCRMQSIAPPKDRGCSIVSLLAAGRVVSVSLP